VDGIDFLLADQNWPFLATMVITLGIAVVQVVSLALGLGLSEAIDNLLPDLDTDIDADIDLDLDADLHVDIDMDMDVDLDADLDADMDADAGGIEGSEVGILGQAFGWLNVGRVPLLILLVCFLGLFTLIGYFGQLAAAALLAPLPAILAGPAAAVVALPATRTASRLLAHVVPKEETYVVRDEEFVGLVARITLGPVDRKTPGKAKLNDRFGNAHFVRLRAANPEDVFQVGNQVLLVSVTAAVFEAIAAPPNLTPG
jgi:hypothetical protein